MKKLLPAPRGKVVVKESWPSFKVLGIRIGAVQFHDVIQNMETWIQEGQKGHYIVVANTHVVMEGYRDKSFRQVLAASSMTIPDGMPLIWMARRRNFPLKERVYGPDLMEKFFMENSEKNYRHFFYGGTKQSLEKLITRVGERFPKLVVSGSYSPPFRLLTTEEDSEVIRTINQARPDIIWVGLGCPKQERWMYDHRHSLRVSVMLGVGQAFDLFADATKQAPRWMRDRGLEWFFRLTRDPKRLWKRYLIYGPQFIFNVLMEEWGIKKFD